MDGPVEPEFNEASLRLNEGLRSCRAVLSSYRVLLGEHRPGANDDDEIPDNDDEIMDLGAEDPSD